MILGPLERRHHSAAIGLMDELRISVGGLMDKALYRAMCSSSEVCCVTARAGEDLAGIALVEFNRRWLWRRPLLVARMVMSRLRSKNAARGESAAPPLALPKNPPIHWSDRAPRVLFIGVAPSWRGKGVGKSLYEAMFDEIRRRSHKYLLARIAPDNTASLRLHEETGWALYEDDGVVFAVKSL
jgi:GNAT superfamily N-acetyltransferase